MAFDIEDLLTRSVPRYTSYPTVPHFETCDGHVDYAAWLAQLDPAQPISLYLHVPYCQKVCWYCGCNMKLAARYSTIAAYVDSLIKEIDLIATALPQRMSVSHLHWGGGTPTSLSPSDLERVMERVWFHFDRADNAEIAIESDPRTLTEDMITRIGALGFNRASFGIQEFDPTVQAAINRIQPFDMVERAVTALRRIGVDAINFDLIYGLPHQTVEMLRTTIDSCIGLRPNRIALFGYAHVPWMAKRQRKIDTEALPGPRTRLAQAEAASIAIRAQGYAQVGMDHFALPDDPLSIASAKGTLRRNFQGYTADNSTTLIGLGATSIGRLPQGYVQNTAETGAWARAIEAGRFAITKRHSLSQNDRIHGDIIEAIMCFGEVDLNTIAQAHGLSESWVTATLNEALMYLPEGLIQIGHGTLRLVEGAEPFVRLVAAAFDQHMHAAPARHSLAV